MNTMIKKRGKGKIVNCLGIKEFFKEYKENQKLLKKELRKHTIKLPKYSKVLRSFNLKLIDLMINESESINLPYRLGSIKVAKCKRKLYNKQLVKSVNWKESKIQGCRIYFDSPFVYKLRWRKKYKLHYMFRASRKVNRRIAEAIIIHHKDYFK